LVLVVSTRAMFSDIRKKNYGDHIFFPKSLTQL
jgi:hypothetical protein